MFERIKRMFRSFIGFFIELGEDPELILKQNIRDMEDQVPVMNQNIAMIKANQVLLDKEKNKLDMSEKELSAKIQAALKAGRRDIALTFATQLEQVKKDLAQTEVQLKTATEAVDKAMQVKSAFMREKERKTREAMSVIQAKKRSEWQGKVADAMESFKIAGLDASHDEMVRKLEQEAAEKEARVSLALEKVDQQTFQIEEEAKKLQANDLLHQFELQMGLATDAVPSGTTAEKTMGPAERDTPERQKVQG
ncbi:MAG: PspA/IM30 family protein [Candidatus Wallbacteria bacterium]|nr:PspA/IM30 family protein [Candidatus Wallbacteria bacterium]